MGGLPCSITHTTRNPLLPLSIIELKEELIGNTVPPPEVCVGPAAIDEKGRILEHLRPLTDGRILPDLRCTRESDTSCCCCTGDVPHGAVLREVVVVAVVKKVQHGHRLGLKHQYFRGVILIL
jgi:hypothetical protein